jgi:hypothetical protein
MTAMNFALSHQLSKAQLHQEMDAVIEYDYHG